MLQQFVYLELEITTLISIKEKINTNHFETSFKFEHPYLRYKKKRKFRMHISSSYSNTLKNDLSHYLNEEADLETRVRISTSQNFVKIYFS